MFTTKIVYLLLVVQNNLKNFLSGDSDSVYIRFTNKNTNSGNDERHYTDTTNITNNIYTQIMLHKIRRNIINKNIIDELQNNNTNIYKKLELIEKYTDIYKTQNKISEFNLLSGNLLKDFYDDDCAI